MATWFGITRGEQSKGKEKKEDFKASGCLSIFALAFLFMMLCGLMVLCHNFLEGDGTATTMRERAKQTPNKKWNIIAQRQKEQIEAAERAGGIRYGGEEGVLYTLDEIKRFVSMVRRVERLRGNELPPYYQTPQTSTIWPPARHLVR